MSDGVVGFFIELVLVVSTHTLTEMSTRIISWEVKLPMHKQEMLASFVWLLSRNPVSLALLEPSGPA